MRIIPLNAVELSKALEASPFQYSRFLAEKSARSGDDDYEVPTEGPEYLYVAAGVVDERPREQWNRLGRAIWNLENIKRTAAGVAEVLESLAADGFVATHKYGPGAWFSLELTDDSRAAGITAFLRRLKKKLPDPVVIRRAALAKMGFLSRHGVDLDLATWIGGFLLEGNPQQFIEQFLDYSHLLYRQPAEMVCQNLPLMLGLDHDLYVYWVSPDRSLLTRVTNELARRSLLFAPSPFLPAPEGEI